MKQNAKVQLPHIIYARRRIICIF